MKLSKAIFSWGGRGRMIVNSLGDIVNLALKGENKRM